jgi:hypothetical protein
VGEQFDPVKGEDGIVASKQGFDQFMALLKGKDDFTIEIKDAL